MSSFILYVRAVLFALGFYPGVVFFAIMNMLNVFLPKKIHYWAGFGWGKYTLWWLKLTCRLSYEIEGLEHLPKENGIALSKHQSAWETVAFQLIFRNPAWVLKRELFRIPFFGWTLYVLNPIAINRKEGSSARKQVIEQGMQRLKEGRWVVIFPEGTRTAPGAQSRFASGGAALAEASGYPVVPIALNAGEFWSRQSFIKKPGVIKVVIGPTIDSRGKTAAEINQQAKNWIEKTVDAISTTKPSSTL